MTSSLLELNKVSITYPSGFRIDDISFSLNAGDCLAISGASGSGKSSILKAIIGLVKIESGEILFNGVKQSIITLRKEVSYMYQRGLLFPHLNVFANLALPISDNLKGSELKDYIFSLLVDCELDPNVYAHRKPRALSGGELQRASLALALVRRPKLLMLDEPFTGLDSKTKLLLVEFIKRLQTKFNMAILLVSHDASDAKLLASKVIEIGVKQNV